MKNIFIVTDFSKASLNAGRYGIELAKYFNARVFLFHAYQVQVQMPESFFVTNADAVWARIKENLEKKAAYINPGKFIDVEICGGVGITSKVIIAEATKRKADLIICGMKGTGINLRKIFGSTSTELSGKSDIPLIIVPENASFQPPKYIALANDMDPETSSVTFKLLKELGEKFISKLSVVWVVDNGIDGAHETRFQPKAFINELNELNPVLEFPEGNNISKALDIFVKEHSIDMMVMIPHKHDLVERIFTESITKKIIFHSRIPVLVLPQKKKNETSNVTADQEITEALG